MSFTVTVTSVMTLIATSGDADEILEDFPYD